MSFHRPTYNRAAFVLFMFAFFYKIQKRVVLIRVIGELALDGFKVRHGALGWQGMVSRGC